MLNAKFLKFATARPRDRYRSRMFNHHAEMRDQVASTSTKPDAIFPLAEALLSMTDFRTAGPQVPSIDSLSIADVEPKKSRRRSPKKAKVNRDAC